MMVVLHHLANQTSRLGLAHVDATVLQAGVDIFFVISGFLMWVTTAERPEKTAVNFLRDRIARIVPLYWLVTTAVVILLLVMPDSFITTVWDTDNIIKSFLFIAAKNIRTGLYQPILIPGWSLNLEMFFYVMFAVAIKLGGTRAHMRAFAILVALGLLVLLGAATSHGGFFAFYTMDIIAEFGAGVALGVLYQIGFRPRPVFALILLLTGAGALSLGAIHPLGLPRSVEWGIPAATVVAGAVFGTPIRIRPLERLGDWSYSLYLTHPITLAASQKVWTSMIASFPIEAFPFFAVAACVAVASVTFRFIEKPSTAAAKRALR